MTLSENKDAEPEKTTRPFFAIVMTASLAVLFLICLLTANVTHFSFANSIIIKAQHLISEGMLHCYYDMEMYSDGAGVVGEILPGNIYEQTMYIPEEMAEYNTVAVSIKMATYSRSNDCTVKVTLSQGENESTVYSDTLDWEDNSYQEFIFEDIEWLEAGEASVTVTCDDSETGNAVTMYYTEYLLFYEYMLQDGEMSIFNFCMKVYIPI